MLKPVTSIVDDQVVPLHAPPTCEAAFDPSTFTVTVWLASLQVPETVNVVVLLALLIYELAVGTVIATLGAVTSFVTDIADDVVELPAASASTPVNE